MKNTEESGSPLSPTMPELRANTASQFISQNLIMPYANCHAFTVAVGSFIDSQKS